jgi:signal transduction histidine kinase
MNIYTRKSGWKIFLFVFAAIIIIVTVWGTHNFLRKIAREEKAKVEIWANAISRKAHLVNYTKELFDDLKKQERRSMTIWSEATKRFVEVNDKEDIKFYTDIISGNDNIPVIVTNENMEVTGGKNLTPFWDTVKVLTPELRDSFTSYDPIVINYYADFNNYIFYQNSRLYVQLKATLDDLVQSFLDEVVENSLSTPVLIVDSTRTNIIAVGGDIDSSRFADSIALQNTIAEMAFSKDPIVVDMPGYGKSYIFYEDSLLLTQLRYFPVALFVVIALFLLISYIMFSISRKAEQNQVWAGMAKESAHQLGTPISSLLGWIEILKMKPESEMEATEMAKDIVRLQQVSERFSKIGSKPELKEEDVNKLIKNAIEYMKRRSSNKIEYRFETGSDEIYHKINPLLLTWVFENLMKNSLDAMDGSGTIKVSTSVNGKSVVIDFSDTGKGIPKGKFKTIFNPGYSTKSRGWGLGLSLAKRIVNQYHRGKIFVKSSSPEEGTTIRIVLK